MAMTPTAKAFSYALEQLALPQGKSLWLYGEHDFAMGDSYQPWHGKALRLKQRRLRSFNDPTMLDPSYDAVFLNCPQERNEAEGLLALAFQHSSLLVMAVAANDAGGNRLKKMFASYGVTPNELSKHHCRIVWTDDASAADPDLIQRNLAALALRELTLKGERWWTVPGIFGWDKIDAGSELLLQHLPKDLSGHVADFGCGYGYLTRTLEARYPAITAIDAYDADARAAACAAKNCNGKVKTFWQDVCNFDAVQRYDAIVMNPPFHSGKSEDVSLGQQFIEKAWQSLKPRSQLCMVANRHLPYEKILPELNLVHESNGYKIMMAKKP